MLPALSSATVTARVIFFVSLLMPLVGGAFMVLCDLVARTILSPRSLPIGAITPQEIAISIFAEMIDTDKWAQRSFGYPKELLSALMEQNGQSKVLATIISKRGSAPRSVGTKMLIREDGSCAATIGGGCQEMYVTELALQMIREGASSPRIIEVDMTPETASEEGMVCGGTVQVLLQPVQV